jgi:hypothetical protein
LAVMAAVEEVLAVSAAAARAAVELAEDGSWLKKITGEIYG